MHMRNFCRQLTQCIRQPELTLKSGATAFVRVVFTGEGRTGFCKYRFCCKDGGCWMYQSPIKACATHRSGRSAVESFGRLRVELGHFQAHGLEFGGSSHGLSFGSVESRRLGHGQRCIKRWWQNRNLVVHTWEQSSVI